MNDARAARTRLRTCLRLRRTTALTAAALLLAAGAAACSSDGGSSPAAGSSASPSGSGASAKVSGTVTVFAAASLKESFTALGKTFEDAHPGTKVVFNFGGSDTLAASITGGAPADVFAAASDKTMKTVTDAGDAAGTPKIFVRNQLEIATVPGNPEKIDALDDLADGRLKVVLCDTEVPCGAAAQKVLAGADVKVTPVSLEPDVKSVLTKVELKEADAGLVYRTDVQAAGDRITGVEFPESSTAVNNYPIAALKEAPNAAGADAFLALVASPEGQKVLTDAGFLAP